MSDTRSRQPRAAAEPSAQADGSPEPVYSADYPEVDVQVPVRAAVASVRPQPEDYDLAEAGYGHGV